MAGSGYWRKDHFNRYYRCSDPDYHSSIKRSDRRGSHYVRRESVHQQVGEYLQRLAQAPLEIDALLETLPEGSEVRWEKERSLLLAQQDELLRRRRRWSDAYETGVIDLTEYAEKIGALDKQEESVRRQVEAIEARIRQSQEHRDHAESLQEAIARLPQMLSEELTDESAEILRAMFSRYVHRVYIKDREVIRLEFRTP